MDAKKKRNKKKKGNQEKNTCDVTGEAAPQHHNHDAVRTDHHKGTDADDAMSSFGEGVPQYQNHEPTPQTHHNGVGEGIPSYQNNEPTMTQENHKVINAVPADQRSIGMSESSVELDVHRLYGAKLDKIHETIKHLEDEKSLWLQKVSILESELEKLNNKVGYYSQNEVLLEEKLSTLQNGYDSLVKEEEVLDNKVRCIEDINDTLTHQEASLKERLSGLEETNKALQLQVKVLEETSNNTVEENLRLVKSLNDLDSRVHALEAEAALSEASINEKVPGFKVMDGMDLTGSVLHHQTTGFTEGNEMVADIGVNSSVTIISDGNYSQINNSPGNHLEEASTQLWGKVSSNSTAQGLVSEEIVQVPLDDIQIHEDDAQQSGEDDETAEVPFSDAPIIGAPFRLISFVARYVSGADLVTEK